MLENGAEMYRVEDTMNRIADNYGKEEGISFVTPTIVLMGLESSKSVQMKRISERTTNLTKVAAVNELSWQFAQGKVDLADLNEALKQVSQEEVPPQTIQRILWAAVLSGCLMILLGGTWRDFLATCFVGGGGYVVYSLSVRFLKLKYIDEFLGAFTIGMLAFILSKNISELTLANMIIGSIMPLVPGVAITNTVRDLQEGHMLSGISRGVEALFIAMMIGAGIAAAFYLMNEKVVVPQDVSVSGTSCLKFCLCVRFFRDYSGTPQRVTV